MNSEYWFFSQEVSAFKNGYEVVKNLNIKFKNEERILILGPNGSGKSSIIDLINRNLYPIQKPNSILKIFDKELIDIWYLRKKVSTVNNEIKSRINPHLTVSDLLISGLHGTFCKVKKIKEEEKFLSENLLKKINLTKLSEKKFGFLSDGEKQIALIARAIINNPKVLILDEPSANLDLKSKFFLNDHIKYLSKIGISILCVTHDISMITKEFNRVILIKDRTILNDGYPSKIMTDKNINELFEIKVNLLESQNNWEVIREII